MAKKKQGVKIMQFPDLLRGSDKEVSLRLDPDDVLTLLCDSEYDQALTQEIEGKRRYRVMLLRKVEVQNKDGSFSPYPSVTWLDEVEQEEQLVTKALIRKMGDTAVYIMSSSQGVPDGKLMVAAKEASIYTESLFG